MQLSTEFYIIDDKKKTKDLEIKLNKKRTFIFNKRTLCKCFV